LSYPPPVSYWPLPSQPHPKLDGVYMKRWKEHQIDEALERYYAETLVADSSRVGTRRRSALVPFIMGLLTFGLVIGLILALWRWGPELLEKRGLLETRQAAKPVLEDVLPQIGPGCYVRGVNTQGMGLHLRAQPGLESPRLVALSEGVVLLVIEGPHQANGHIWWKVRHENQSGWCAADWLELCEVPQAER